MKTPIRMLVTLVAILSGGLSAVTATALAHQAVNDESIVSTSFEEAQSGQFEKLITTVGTWTPENGRTIVDSKHAKTGKQCLQLTGGSQTTVILELADTADATGILSFWAERWTSRAPFSFRIEKRVDDQWKEIFNGDQSVRVGRSFLNHVSIPLGDKSIKQLRFTVTCPENTGVLLDDLRIAPARQHQVDSVEAVAFTLPALVGTKASPLVKLKVVTSGQLDRLAVTGVSVQFHGAVEAIEQDSIHVYREGSDRSKRFDNPLTLSQSATKGSEQRSYLERPGATRAAARELTEGENTIWIAAKLKPGANIDHAVGASIKQITLSNGKTVKLDSTPSPQRLGVAIRQAGQDAVHTFRIPGLATTNEGTLIGVYDVRHRTGGDLPGDIDVGMSRSTDGGRTWEPMKVIVDMGADPDWRYDGIGDPAILVDQITGTIWVASTWSHGNRSWRGSGPGLKPEETGQLMLTRSDDDGRTWSPPINITRQVKRPEWCFLLQGPGKGITMRDGTIVFAAQYQDTPENKRLPRSTIIYSKDHGTTWQIGTGAFDDTTEAQVVEVEPGVLMLNCRYNRKAARVVMTTRDMGKTWQKHTTSERALIEPRACMASLIDVDQELGKDAGGWLLFSNPDSTQGRHHLTIKASADRGLTWPKEHRLLLDEGNSAGYSCMTMIDEQTIGILYEGSQAHMTFQRVSLNDLIGKEAAAEPKANASSRRDQPQPDHRPNILLIVGEDHGCELSCYGDRVIETPNLDRLAAGGVLFERGYVTQSVCSPSRSTIFTGLYPHQNGQLGLATHGYGWFRKWPTTYSLLKQAGYRTGLIGKTHVIPVDAVEAHVDFRYQESANFAKKRVADYATKAGEFFRAGNEPFFMTVNYPDAHWPLQGRVDGLPPQRVDRADVRVMPYIGHETPRLREIVRNYYDCMLRLDVCVGQLLTQLEQAGKADNTLVVFIGDHGAQMARGKVTVYEGGMRVPYLVRWPGVTKPKLRSRALVSTIDLLPTFMDAAGVEPPSDMPGKSLRPALQAAVDVEFREYLVCERNCDTAQHTFPQRTIRDSRYKLIHSPVRDREDPAARYYRENGATHWSGCPTDAELAGASQRTRAGYERWLNPPEFQLYDLHADPHEWTDLANEQKHAATKQRLRAALSEWQVETQDPITDPNKLQALMEENDAVFKAGRRSPQAGWRYLEYLAPTKVPAR